MAPAVHAAGNARLQAVASRDERRVGALSSRGRVHCVVRSGHRRPRRGRRVRVPGQPPARGVGSPCPWRRQARALREAARPSTMPQAGGWRRPHAMPIGCWSRRCGAAGIRGSDAWPSSRPSAILGERDVGRQRLHVPRRDRRQLPCPARDGRRCAARRRRLPGARVDGDDRPAPPRASVDRVERAARDARASTPPRGSPPPSTGRRGRRRSRRSRCPSTSTSSSPARRRSPAWGRALPSRTWREPSTLAGRRPESSPSRQSTRTSSWWRRSATAQLVAAPGACRSTESLGVASVLDLIRSKGCIVRRLAALDGHAFGVRRKVRQGSWPHAAVTASRRDFIKLAGLGAGTAVLGLGAASAAAVVDRGFGRACDAAWGSGCLRTRRCSIDGWPSTSWQSTPIRGRCSRRSGRSRALIEGNPEIYMYFHLMFEHLPHAAGSP